MNLLWGSTNFRRNLVRIASANVLAQVVGLAALPVLSRIFLPENFATFATFSMIHGICLAFVTARIDWIIPNARTKGQASRLMTMSIAILLASTGLLTIVTLIARERFEMFLNVSSGSMIPIFLPVGVFGGGLYLLLQARAIYSGSLVSVSLSKIVQALSTLALSLCFGFLLIKEDGLVVAYVMGIGFAVLVMCRKDSAIIAAKLGLRIRRFSRLLCSYSRQIGASVSLSIVNVLFQSSGLLLLIIFYDPVIVGWYSLVFRLATAPIGLVTTAVAQSFWAEAADLAKRDAPALRKFYLRSVMRLVVVSVPFLIAFLLAPFYIPVLLGEEEWSGAGYLLAAVTPYLVGMIVFSPTTHLIVYRKANWQLVIDLVTLCVSALVFILLTRIGEVAWVALFGASVVNLIGYLVRFVAHLRANEQLVRQNWSQQIYIDSRK